MYNKIHQPWINTEHWCHGRSTQSTLCQSFHRYFSSTVSIQIHLLPSLRPNQWVPGLPSTWPSRHTTADLDGIPASFLRTGAPIFSRPLATLFNLSLTSAVVPDQWKDAFITPIPKVTHPAAASDYRPISITPVLSRTMERIMTSMSSVLYLPGIPLSTIQPWYHWPVRIPPHWVNNRRAHYLTPYNNFHAHYFYLCSCFGLRF